MGSRLAARRLRRGLAAGSVLFASLFTCLFAAPAFADEAAAEQLFQDGLAAMKRNDYSVACEAFLQSNKADPSPGTQINLAVCYEKQRKWASAWTWYRSAVGLAQQRNQHEREQLAEDAAKRLKSQLHYLVIVTKDPASDVVVKRDGAEVTTEVAGKPVPLPIDPGDHTLEVTGTGKKAWQKKIVVADNAETERIEVPKLENGPPSPSRARSSDHDAPAGGRLVVGEGSGQRTVGIVVGAAGILAALAAGGVFIAAKGQADKRDTENDAANAETNPQQKTNDQVSASSFDSAAKSDQLIAIVLGAGAVVLVGVGVVLFATAPKRTDAAVGFHWTPLLSPTTAGMGLGATF
jgi:hypothetical protein